MPLVIWVLANSVLVRIDSQAFESHSQCLEAVERGTPGVFIQGPTDSQQFQIAHQWIHLCSHLGSYWFCITWEQTPKPLNFILSRVNLSKGVFQRFPIRSQSIPNNSRWHSNKSASMQIWVPADWELGENRLSSYLSKFSVDLSDGRGYSSSFYPGPHWFLGVPDGTTMNPP